MPHTETHMETAIQEALNCHNVCLETIDYCLQLGEAHADPAHIKLLQDCAEICQTTANFMVRQSEMHGRVCLVCAEVCQRCAKSCEGFDDDEQMRRCAEACRSCAQTCREMAKVAP